MGASTLRRRNKGAGSQRAGGTWRVRVNACGITRDFYGATQKEARTRAEAWQRMASATPGLARRASPLSVGEWLAEWLTANRGQLKPQTWSRYEQLARLQMVPALGTVRLSSLSAEHVRRLHAAVAQAGLSPTTQHHVHVVLGTALQAALDQGLIAANPSRMVRAPRSARREKTVLTREEATRLIQTSRGERYHAAYVLALTTGMRIGELLALRWRDVDLDRATLTVNGTVVRTVEGVLAIQEPKTRSARRQVQLSAIAVEALRGVEARGELVFPAPTGGLMASNAVLNQHFRPVSRRAGCPGATTLHDLRHTCATHLLEDGVPAHVVSRMLGHASVATTLAIYAHVTPRLLDAARLAMDERYRAAS